MRRHRFAEHGQGKEAQGHGDELPRSGKVGSRGGFAGRSAVTEKLRTVTA